MAEMTKNELVHSTRGEFINNNNWGGECRVITNKERYQIYKQFLKQFYLETGPTDTHTHTQIPQKEMDLEVFIAPSARREDELREENVLLPGRVHAAGRPHLPGAPVAKETDQGSRTQRRRDEVISRDEMVDRLL